MSNISKVFRSDNKESFTQPERQSQGVLDDFAVRKSIQTQSIKATDTIQTVILSATETFAHDIYTNTLNEFTPSNNIVFQNPLKYTTGAGAGKVLTSDANGVASWAAPSSATHNLLSATHSDTLPGSVATGDIIIGNATPKWDKLTANTTATKKYLQSVSTGVPSWQQINYSDLTGAVGATTQIIYNNAGVMTGNANFEYDGTSQTVNSSGIATKEYGGEIKGYTIVNSAGGYSVTDRDRYIYVSPCGGPTYIYLPTCTASGRLITIKSLSDCGGNPVIIATSGDNIDGASCQFYLNNQFDTITVQDLGDCPSSVTGWMIVSSYSPGYFC